MPVGMILLVASLIAPAYAQSDPFPWDQPPPDAQLAADTTVIPLGKGALLVPSLTDPALEPPVILVMADQEVLDIPTGRRVILDPGTYTVIVSPSSPGEGVAVSVEVKDAETTVVPVRWGALRIEVTDGKRVPHRGGYELIRADTRQPIGTGFGADTLQGEALLTWLLPPGVYRIVRIGNDYRALKDFASVYVPESGFVRYRLVEDPETGAFLGAGVLLPDEWGTPKTQDSPWFKSLILGADGAFAQQNNVVGLPDQTVLSGNLFADGQFSYHRGDHTLTLLGQVEEGASQIRSEVTGTLPFVKSRDRLRADLLYTWFVGEHVGPYARAAAETQAFSTNLLVTEDTDFVRQYPDGTITSETVAAGDSFRIADAFRPSIIREGAGLNWRLSTNRWYTLNLRAGLGMRQSQYNGAAQPADLPGTDALEYVQLESYNQAGAESTIIATVKGPGWATWSTNLDLFLDARIANPEGRPGESVSAEWRNTVSLRLTRNLSVNWFGNIDYVGPLCTSDAPLRDCIQLDHSVLLRASFSLL